MRASRVAALVGVVLICAAGAWLLGRATRPSPRAPDTVAASIKPRTIDPARWVWPAIEIPALAPVAPAPTAVTQEPG
jgi:hypothetical protein